LLFEKKKLSFCLGFNKILRYKVFSLQFFKNPDRSPSNLMFSGIGLTYTSVLPTLRKCLWSGQPKISALGENVRQHALKEVHIIVIYKGSCFKNGKKNQ
jgi:hypothetical protein